MHFISFGFLLATTCVWVWIVCSLHSVTTGSRDRANVPLIIIIIIPNWHRVRAITKTTSLDRLRLVFSSTWWSYKPHAQPRVEPNVHNTLLCVKRSGSEILGQVYDYRTSQEGAVPGQELDRWREGTLDGPSGKCTRNIPHW